MKKLLILFALLTMTGLILFAFLTMTGCVGQCNRLYTKYTGNLTYKCTKYGIEYVQSDSGLALSIDGSGYPVKCKP